MSTEAGGVPSSVLIGDDHMQVRASLVAWVKSANAALIWTRIEYRARHVAFAHEFAGRMWWEVKISDLADEVGLSVDQTDRALKKLVDGGFLLAEQHSLPMQTLSYSVVIVQSAESRIGIRDIATSNPRNRDVQSAISRIPPSIEEREEEEEGGTRGTRIPQPFVVTAEMVEWAREHVPLVDGRRSTEMFENFFLAAPGQKGVKRDWVRTWRNWLLKDQADAERRPLTPMQRAQQTMAAGGRAAERRSIHPRREIAS